MEEPIQFYFEPQSDITNQELALLIALLMATLNRGNPFINVHPGDLEFFQESFPSLMRHFVREAEE